MKKAVIESIGIICRLGNTPEEVKKNIFSDSVLPYGKREYISCVPSVKRRRIDRYADLSVNVAQKALENSGRERNAEIGAIFATGFGPMNSCAQFVKKVASGDPDLCSPIQFSQTVPNSCVGQIAMNLGCKGSSSVMMGSNQIGYTQMLLDRDADSVLLTGAVEEYNEELFDACGNGIVSEGAVCFCIAADRGQRGCRLVDFTECDIGDYPLIHAVDERYAEENLTECLRAFPYTPDVVTLADCGTFSEKEREIMDKLYPNAEKISVKKEFGETLGAAFSMNVAAASLLYADTGKKVLVAGCEVSGSFSAYFIEP